MFPERRLQDRFKRVMYVRRGSVCIIPFVFMRPGALSKVVLWCYIEFSILSVCGCASTKQFVPMPNPSLGNESNAYIKLTRSWQFGGCANPLIVEDGDETIGEVGPGGSLLWERSAGPITLTVGPAIFNYGDFTPIHTNVYGSQMYIFEVHFPWWYPLRKRGLRYVSTSKLCVTQTENTEANQAVEEMGISSN